MKRRTQQLTAALVLAGALMAPSAQAQRSSSAASDPGLVRLEQEIARLAPIGGGTMGAIAVHLESGRTARFNADQPFPLASSYKVAIAVQLLTRVGNREIRLDSMITLQPTDLHPGSGTLSELFRQPGVSLSLRNLLELMLLISDNSATDIVLRTAGGGAAVTQRMRALGIEGVRVDRPTVRLIGDWSGIKDLPPDEQLTIASFGQAARRVTPEERRAADAAFNTDPRDTATPDGMGLLLQKIWRGEALDAENTALLLDIMTRSTTGELRIKGMLPPQVRVAHKTGTIGGTTNDVGIITLPDNGGHVAVAIFVKASPLPVETRERAIAQVARAIYDYFLFTPRS